MSVPPSIASLPPRHLLTTYLGGTLGFDESAEALGEPRPHWKDFLASLERLGPEELTLRWENARRLIREHGVTYNVYGDPQGTDRPWVLDVVPLLIPPAEWKAIQEGLVQRAHLFNLILADIYGPQRLLHDGMLPPAFVFANPNFLRPCHNIQVARDIHLHLHGADLARGADGQWWVLADRTQAPSGAGYALENRIVLSRTLPDEFRDCRVERLASFFSVHRETLRGLALRRGDNPNIVLLTPGPFNETYFEHAYLARYLGFTLVEGEDLTVRDQRVFIKTLEGLQPVDVILRRLDSSFCDPLELRGDSFLGVAGLVEAARAGNVTVANALGSGLIESPAFLAFLPGLCRHLLGEDLKLPSVATWWCGQSKEQQYVIDHLNEIVVKPAFGSVSREPFFGADMDEKARNDLIGKIRARPHEFVGQERIALSTAPVWLNQQLEPRPVVLRTYITAAHDSFMVMPGGLARVSTAAEDPVVSMQRGGLSKDAWVLSETAVSTMSLLTPSGQPISVSRSAGKLPSRVADNLFWLGRYAERLEETLRILRCVAVRMADESGAELTPELSAVVQLLVQLDILPKRFKDQATLKELEAEMLVLINKPDRHDGVREVLAHVRGIASVVRDRFSWDTWSVLNQLHLHARPRPHRAAFSEALAVLNTLIVDLAAFSGMEMENMTRGHGWRFLDFGRRLERGIHLIKLLRASLGKDVQTNSILEPVLEISDSVMTYRRRYFSGVQLPTVLELLLMDEANPRSLAFQLEVLHEHAANLPGDAKAPGAGEETRRIEALTARIRAADLRSLTEAGAEPLQALLLHCSNDLAGLSSQLAHHYFSHTVASVS